MMNHIKVVLEFIKLDPPGTEPEQIYVDYLVIGGQMGLGELSRYDIASFDGEAGGWRDSWGSELDFTPKAYADINPILGTAVRLEA